MGGGGPGTQNLAGGTGSDLSALNPLGFAGSRAAVTGNQQQQQSDAFSQWLASIPNANAAPTSASPLMSNPVAPGTQAGPAPASAAGFTHSPYPTSTNLPHIGAPDPPPPPAPVAPTEPVKGPMRQIWPPAGGATAGNWAAANPNWQTDFNRAEQRADGSWWVPEDPNEKRPTAGPQYYQGTGNVTYAYSPSSQGGQR